MIIIFSLSLSLSRARTLSLQVKLDEERKRSASSSQASSMNTPYTGTRTNTAHTDTHACKVPNADPRTIYVSIYLSIYLSILISTCALHRQAAWKTRAAPPRPRPCAAVAAAAATGQGHRVMLVPTIEGVMRVQTKGDAAHRVTRAITVPFLAAAPRTLRRTARRRTARPGTTWRHSSQDFKV